MGQQSEMLVLAHTYNRGLLIEFQFIRFLVKTGPCIIPSSFDCQRQRLGLAAQGLHTLESIVFEIICGVKIYIFRCNGDVVLGIYINRRHCSRRSGGLGRER